MILLSINHLNSWCLTFPGTTMLQLRHCLQSLHRRSGFALLVPIHLFGPLCRRCCRQKKIMNNTFNLQQYPIIWMQMIIYVLIVYVWKKMWENWLKNHAVVRPLTHTSRYWFHGVKYQDIDIQRQNNMMGSTPRCSFCH